MSSIKRIVFAALDEGIPLPIDIKDCVIYYCGPTPAPEGMPIGSAGPTTSVRMDKFAPTLYDMGMICNFADIFGTLVKSTGSVAASLVESNESKVQKEIDKFLESILDYEE